MLVPTMLVPALAAFFKYRVVRSIFIVACWPFHEQTKFVREVTSHGLSATFAFDPSALLNINRYGLQGVVYFKQPDDTLLKKSISKFFTGRYVWLVVGDGAPAKLNQARYDAEVVLLRTYEANESTAITSGAEITDLEDVHVHPSEGVSVYPWAYWSKANGFYVPQMLERNRILRRLDFRGHPLRIAAPIGKYSNEWYNGTYSEYMVDETLIELDAVIRSGYGASSLVIQLLNATEVLQIVDLWGTTVSNSSMIIKLMYEEAELSGANLRMLLNRFLVLDYFMPMWPFSVGFTYLAERESSSNMFIEPFTVGVWWACLGIGIILAFALRITARNLEEKDSAFCAALATWLQQDATGVPQGISGRWTFTVLSICAMLVHAYYTSAIVSALMSAGSGGPDSLRSLADSKYAIASEDYCYIRYLYFDVKSNWSDLEYLKRKKMTNNFYLERERGAQLIQEGRTAFHSEYNQIFPLFKSFSDDQICKLAHIDTIPEVMSWITTTKGGQYTNTFRIAGAWIHEIGLGKRLVTRFTSLRPPCRSQLLAERVKFGDVAPLMKLTAFGAFLSLVLLGVEILVARFNKDRRLLDKDHSDATNVDNVEESTK